MQIMCDPTVKIERKWSSEDLNRSLLHRIKKIEERRGEESTGSFIPHKVLKGFYSENQLMRG